MDALNDEVESLEAILMDDVRIKRHPESGAPELIETTVLPIVGEEAEQYVCVTLQVLPTEGYPDVSPEFKLVRPRGLDDIRLEAIKRACLDKLQDLLGSPVVFDLIEIVREHLTISNLPSGQCVICLYGFTEGDEFTRTECFHFLHSYCLGRHLNAMRRNYQEEFEKLPAWLQKTADPFQAVCPVCRENIRDESDSLKCAMPPAELQNAPEFKLTEELRELQQRMCALFLQQKSRGGIIDMEAEIAPVISIETEADLRRRRERRNEEAIITDTNTEQNNGLAIGVGSSVACGGNAANKTENNEIGSGSAAIEPKNSSTVIPIKPVVNNTGPRVDPTNNNYHPHMHRRHNRGGRRHQQHNHHHRDRERERERFENNHISHSTSSSNTASGGSNNSNPSTSHANTNHGSSSGGKQAKAHAANNIHSR